VIASLSLLIAIEFHAKPQSIAKPDSKARLILTNFLLTFNTVLIRPVLA
jgi:hypothetical protein